MSRAIFAATIRLLLGDVTISLPIASGMGGEHPAGVALAYNVTGNV